MKRAVRIVRRETGGEPLYCLAPANLKGCANLTCAENGFLRKYELEADSCNLPSRVRPNEIIWAVLIKIFKQKNEMEDNGFGSKHAVTVHFSYYKDDLDQLHALERKYAQAWRTDLHLI